MTRHIIPISGKDSLCTALVQTATEPGLPYEYLFCDVGAELPETYQWLGAVEQRLGKVTRVGRSLPVLIQEMTTLPSHHRRFCTALAKIEPMRSYFGEEDDIVQYLGIRADEDNRIPSNYVFPDNVETRYPLVEQGVCLNDVYRLLEEHGIGPPNFFWAKLYSTIYNVAGVEDQTYLDLLNTWQRARLFSWRSRSNCYFCFYQRLYEWVGLLEHHPELFAAAEKMESTYGASFASRPDFYIRGSGLPLSDIRIRAKSIFNARAKDVYLAVIEQRRNPDDDVPQLNQTSCGIHCGK